MLRAAVLSGREDKDRERILTMLERPPRNRRDDPRAVEAESDAFFAALADDVSRRKRKSGI